MRRWQPRWLSNAVRQVGTAVLTPLRFSFLSGHWRSSLKALAMDRQGRPLPWYTYPAIDFLATRDYRGRSVLEFGGGQSTLWWAGRAQRVLTIESDPDWYRRLQARIPGNVRLELLDAGDPARFAAAVQALLADQAAFDVIVIDGRWRYLMLELALPLMGEESVLIIDNAEWPGFHPRLLQTSLLRCDFHGHAPGVVLPHSTSICFGPKAFVVQAVQPVPGYRARAADPDHARH